MSREWEGWPKVEEGQYFVSRVSALSFSLPLPPLTTAVNYLAADWRGLSHAWLDGE